MEQPTIKFHYIKSERYEEYPVNGALGNLTPAGDRVFMAFFSERTPIPRSTVHPLGEGGRLLAPIEGQTDQRDGLIRFVHAGFFLDREALTNLRAWIDERLKDMDGMKETKR